MIPLWAIKPLCQLAVAGLVAWGAWEIHDTIWQRGYDQRDTEAKAEMQAYRLSVEAERLRYAEAARATEQRHREAFDAIATKHEQERRDAEQAADRLVADLRAGTVRLREQWRGCQAGSRLPQAADSAGKSDAADELRNAAAAAVVRIGADCDARIRGLQRYAEAVSQ